MTNLLIIVALQLCNHPTLAAGQTAAHIWGVADKSAGSAQISFITDLANRAITVLGSHNGTEAKKAQLAELFQEKFDVPGIARRALARYWNRMSPAQQVEVTSLLSISLRRTVARELENVVTLYHGEQLRVTAQRARNTSESEVDTLLIYPGRSTPPSHVEWLISNRDDQLKVTDVGVNGSSMFAAVKTPVASAVYKGGVDRLFAYLRSGEPLFYFNCDAIEGCAEIVPFPAD